MVSDTIQKYLHSYDHIKKTLSKRVLEEIDFVLKVKEVNILAQISRTESPIEQLLVIHLIDMFEELRHELIIYDGEYRLKFETQKEIKVSRKTYRLDFYLSCTLFGKTYEFAIECDGHNFHEKTKEQAKRDKQRDRALQNEGYTIIRFTGSEIWESPVKCASEFQEIVRKKIGIKEIEEIDF